MPDFAGFNFHHDQAAGLRRMMTSAKPRIFSLLAAHTPFANKHSPDTEKYHQTKTISNLATALTRLGADVLVVYAGHHANSTQPPFDLNDYPSMMDAASTNVIPFSTQYTRAHCTVKNLQAGYAVTKLLPQHTDIHQYDARSVHLLNTLFINIANDFGIVLVDTAITQQQTLPLAGLNHSDIVIQLNQQPESIKNAYALIKLLCKQPGRRSFSMLIHDTNAQQAGKVFNNIALVARRYMRIELAYLGFIPADEHLNRAAKLGQSVTEVFPLAAAAQAFKALALKFDDQHARCGSPLLKPMQLI